ncbi:MAG: ornithine carbamoyltransferase [Dehalococcoidia bacterium]|nr:ornithine carbamoyltransferase [Dehalococcoidia bacterium]
MKKDFLAVSDFTSAEVADIVRQAESLKRSNARPLNGKVIALLFEKPSLRTRVSFEIGIRQLGGDCIYLSKEDVNLGVREPVEDVARVLDRWVDGIVARVNAHESLVTMAAHMNVPVINALSDLEHPCQAMADLQTIAQHKDRFDGIRVAYIGDGNNVAASLAVGCASVGADFVIANPPAYGVPESVWDTALQRAEASGSSVTRVELPEDAVRDADVVYTDTWVSMGQEAEKAERVKAFANYQVNPALMEYAKPDSIFMHDMPAYAGAEISEGMIDDLRSVVFDQAENRLHAQNAVMVTLFS